MTPEHDDDIVRRVHRTLTAVAEATPIDPPLADDLRELTRLVDTDGTADTPSGSDSGSGFADAAGTRVLTEPFDLTGAGTGSDTAGQATPPRPGHARHARHARRNGYGRGRTLALAAAVLAIAMAAAATWMIRPGGDDQPAVQVGDGGGRLEATWVPDGLGGSDPEVTATDGLDVDLQAAVYRSQAAPDGALSMATGAMDEATADAVFEALNRVIRADETGYGAGSGFADPSAGPAVAGIAWGAPTGEENVQVFDQIRDGTSPADVHVDGLTTTPVAVDWVPGIAASQTIRYGDPVPGSSCRASTPICPDAWAEVTTTRGTLPEPDALTELLPNAGQVDLGDRTVWVSTWRDHPTFAPDRAGAPVILVLWQEADGVIGSVLAEGLDDEAILRIARETHWTEGASPAPVVQPRHIGSWRAVAGPRPEFSIEAWEDSWRGTANGPTTICWRVRLPADTVPPLPVCGGVDGTFREGRELGDDLFLFGTIAGPEVANVQPTGTMETFPAMPLGDDPASERLVFVVGTEAQAHEETLDILDADGNVLTEVEVLHE